jgi:hypothetical protein
MKAKEVWVTMAALTAIVVVSVLAYRYETRPPEDICQICQRSVHGVVEFRLDTAKGSEVACCPRCVMHYAIQHPGAVRRSWAADLNSGELIPADSAYYDEGGDAEYCTHGELPIQREMDGVSVRGYDLCLPTLVAFKTQSDTEAYQRQHGGRVLNYARAMESVKAQ